MAVFCKPGEHNYQPRYDEVESAAARMGAHTRAFFGGPEPAKDRIYIGDACTKCGDFVPRPKAN